MQDTSSSCSKLQSSSAKEETRTPTGSMLSHADSNHQHQKHKGVKSKSFVDKPLLSAPPNALAPVLVELHVNGEILEEMLCWWAGDRTESTILPIAVNMAEERGFPIEVAEHIAHQIMFQVTTYAQSAPWANTPWMKLPERVVPVHLNVLLGNAYLQDKVMWDINSSTNDPDEYASTLCSDLQIPQVLVPLVSFKFRQAIFHKIKPVQGAGKPKGVPTQLPSLIQLSPKDLKKVQEHETNQRNIWRAQVCEGLQKFLPKLKQNQTDQQAALAKQKQKRKAVEPVVSPDNPKTPAHNMLRGTAPEIQPLPVPKKIKQRHGNLSPSPQNIAGHPYPRTPMMHPVGKIRTPAASPPPLASLTPVSTGVDTPNSTKLTPSAAMLTPPKSSTVKASTVCNKELAIPGTETSRGEGRPLGEECDLGAKTKIPSLDAAVDDSEIKGVILTPRPACQSLPS
mmetsp:Transcript_13326/g.25559  ORF Transcript_13326/g.25559 Transcript_13326/m.25559 type:complete len:453 (+) Transcript_13326:242-1600(+)